MDFILKFNEQEPTIDTEHIVYYTVAILVLETLTTTVINKILYDTHKTTIVEEQNTEYKTYKDKNIPLPNVFINELTNSVFFSPIAEEFVFKIFVLKIICTKYLKLNSHVSNILQSILFSLLHLSNYMITNQTKIYNTVQCVSALFSSMVTGYVYIHTNSILPPLIAHILINLFSSINTLINYNIYIKDNT